MRTVGLILGLVITAGACLLLYQDRGVRVDAARRQSMALATGVDRVLMHELRNLERALAGIVIDSESFSRNAPESASTLLSDTIDGVLSRHPELASITLLDDKGSAKSAGADDPDFPTWIAAAPTATRPLVLGPLQSEGSNAWALPIALPIGRDRWLVARLHTWELQRMIDRLDTGRDGSVAIMNRDGVVLARSLDSDAYIGRRVALPSELLSDSAGTAVELVSELDQVAREATFVSESGYPVVVGAGIGLDEALAPWHRYLAATVVLVALYWLGLWLLLRRMASAEVVREWMLDELEANADWLQQAQRAARTGVWRIESDRGQVRASDNMAEMFGFSPTAEEIPIERFFERLHDDDRARVAHEFAESRTSKSPFKLEYRIVLPDGRERWIIARGAMATDAHGSERMTGTVVDITERHEALARVERAESQFRELFERNPLPFWVFDTETLRFLAVNEAAVNSYGFSRDEFLEMTILDIRPDEDAEEVRKSIKGTDYNSDRGRVWAHFTRDGHRMDVRIHSSSIDFAGRPARLVLAEDVTERIAHERDLAWRATHDPMTRLLTVPALVEEIDALSRESCSGYAIAYVQLRDLELVAPTLGGHASEAILRAAAERFGWIGQKYGFAAYRPADSFVIVALDSSQRDDMLASLVRATSTPAASDGGTHPLETWIGLADGPISGGGAEQVIGNAALAALEARRENMPIVVFDATMSAQAGERLALAGRLRQALEQEDFELFYQPIQRVDTGELDTLEALLRWRKPDGGFVPPLDFIPLCEESGLILPLGEWVLGEAARSHGVLASRGLGHVAIAVNISGVQVLSDTLPGFIRALREKYGLPRNALQVELTESVLLRRPDVARATMTELRADGVCISLDDFGTGFSSMGYLRDLPLDYLKVDRIFVANVHQDPRNASICRALISLAHGLKLKIVAEGVESAEQLDWLRTHGCDKAQGYHLGRPAPLADVLAALPATSPRRVAL